MKLAQYLCANVLLVVCGPAPLTFLNFALNQKILYTFVVYCIQGCLALCCPRCSGTVQEIKLFTNWLSHFFKKENLFHKLFEISPYEACIIVVFSNAKYFKSSVVILFSKIRTSEFK